MSNLLPPKELEEIKERADKATPGEWIPNGYEDETEFHLESLESSEGYMVGTPADPVTGDFVFFREEDVPFFTKARQDIPRLLQHIEELEKALAQAVEFAGIKFVEGPGIVSALRFTEPEYVPELTAYLRTKEAGSGEGEKDA